MVVERALQALTNDFASADSIGPVRAAQFDDKSGDELHAATADAHGYIDDLMRAYRADRAHQR